MLEFSFTEYLQSPVGASLCHNRPCRNEVLEVLLVLEPADRNHALFRKPGDLSGRRCHRIEYSFHPTAVPFPDRKIMLCQRHHAVIFGDSALEHMRPQPCIGVHEYAAVLPVEFVVAEMVLGDARASARNRRQYPHFRAAQGHAHIRVQHLHHHRQSLPDTALEPLRSPGRQDGSAALRTGTAGSRAGRAADSRGDRSSRRVGSGVCTGRMAGKGEVRSREIHYIHRRVNRKEWLATLEAQNHDRDFMAS